MIHYDWHSAFLALGIVGVIWTTLWLLFGAEGTVDEHPVEEAAATPLTVDLRVPYRMLLTDRTLIGTFMLSFVGFLVLSLCFTWFPAYLRLGLGYSATEAGWLFSLIVGAAMPVSLAMSWFSQTLFARGVPSRISRGWVASGSVALTGLAMLATTTDISATMKIVSLIVGACFGQLIFLFGPLMIGEVTPAPQRGAWLGINNSLATLAGLIAPALMGRFVGIARGQASGFEHGFLILGVVLVGTGVAAWWLVDPEGSLRRLRQRSLAPNASDQRAVRLSA
jgi:sugar phosphate permease